MLIRSQDKLQLVPMETGSISAGYIDGEDSKRIYFYNAVSSTPTSTLGLYSTKEKAIKVLDMIQQTYENSLYCNHAFDNAAQVQRPYIIAQNAVFQMPQDKEVRD